MYARTMSEEDREEALQTLEYAETKNKFGNEAFKEFRFEDAIARYKKALQDLDHIWLEEDF